MADVEVVAEDLLFPEGPIGVDHDVGSPVAAHADRSAAVAQPREKAARRKRDAEPLLEQSAGPVSQLVHVLGQFR